MAGADRTSGEKTHGPDYIIFSETWYRYQVDLVSGCPHQRKHVDSAQQARRRSDLNSSHMVLHFSMYYGKQPTDRFHH
jgi:hypothetical protein